MMIRIERLTKTYKDVRALDNLTLTVERGSIYGFLGPNGAGKSTTIMSILGLVYPNSGSIVVRDVQVISNGKLLEGNLVEVKKFIGYMPENATLWDYLTPIQTLEEIGKAHKTPKEEVLSRGREILQRLDLWNVKNKKVGKFSKGMKQKLLLAQALVHDPELLILDEPMTGLDPAGIATFKDIIKEEQKRGKTIFFSSHILAHVEEVCDTVGVVVGGRLVKEGRIEDIKEEFLRKGGFVIFLETNKPINFENPPWDVKKVDEKRYVIRATTDIREDLNDIVWSQGAKILQLKVRVPSLEEIFLKMVKDE